MQEFYETIETDTRFRKLPPEKFIHKACTYNFLRFSSNNERKIWIYEQRYGGCKVTIHTDIQTYKVTFFVHIWLDNLFYLY